MRLHRARPHSFHAEWKALREHVLRRDNWECWICGQRAVTADHVLPRSHGGEDTPENLRAICTVCNSRRGNRANSYANQTISWNGSDISDDC